MHRSDAYLIHAARRHWERPCCYRHMKPEAQILTPRERHPIDTGGGRETRSRRASGRRRHESNRERTTTASHSNLKPTHCILAERRKQAYRHTRYSVPMSGKSFDGLNEDHSCIRRKIKLVSEYHESNPGAIHRPIATNIPATKTPETRPWYAKWYEPDAHAVPQTGTR